MAHTIILILLIVFSALLVLLVSLQETKDTGLGALAGNTDQDTFWKQNKDRSKEGVIKKLTVVCSVLMVALTIAANMI